MYWHSELVSRLGRLESGASRRRNWKLSGHREGTVPF